MINFEVNISKTITKYILVNVGVRNVMRGGPVTFSTKFGGAGYEAEIVEADYF